MSAQVIRMEGFVGLRALGGLAVRAETHDVRNNIMRPDSGSLGFHTQGDLDVRLRLLVRIVFWVLPESLRLSATVEMSQSNGSDLEDDKVL